MRLCQICKNECVSKANGIREEYNPIYLKEERLSLCKPCTFEYEEIRNYRDRDGNNYCWWLVRLKTVTRKKSMFTGKWYSETTTDRLCTNAKVTGAIVKNHTNSSLSWFQRITCDYSLKDCMECKQYIDKYTIYREARKWQ